MKDNNFCLANYFCLLMSFILINIHLYFYKDCKIKTCFFTRFDLHHIYCPCVFAKLYEDSFPSFFIVVCLLYILRMTQQNCHSHILALCISTLLLKRLVFTILTKIPLLRQDLMLKFPEGSHHFLWIKSPSPLGKGQGQIVNESDESLYSWIAPKLK
jgi:hypothetical protein